MNPGSTFVRTWIPKKSGTGPYPHNLAYPNNLTIYDAGNIQGWLIEPSLGKPSWIVFQIEGRLQDTTGSFTEMGTIVPEWEAPLHYFSKTTYPMRQQQQAKSHLLFSLPQLEILLTLSLPSSEALPQPPLPQPQPMLSVPPERVADEPASHEPQKSSSSTPVGGQRTSQNKSRTLPKSTALSSSNQGRRAQLSRQDPKTQAKHPQSQPPAYHTDHESSESHPWTSLAQQSLYSRPPPELAKELSEQASISQSPKGSEQS